MSTPKRNSEIAIQQLDWNLLKYFSILVETGGGVADMFNSNKWIGRIGEQ